MSERISLLVTVKAYPAISQKYGEVVCVAGIRTDTPDPEWARLFPVPYRDMPFAQRFKKYQVISLEARKHSGDKRPETYRPTVATLTVGEFLDTKNAWAKRRAFVEPLVVESMCEIRRRQQMDGTSLGAFRPAEVLDFVIDKNVEEWDDSKAGIAAQPSLFFPTKDGLERIPFRFRYRYRCSTPGCREHTQSMIDWELAQSWRKWRELYDETTLLENLRKRFLETMCGPGKDTIFFVGNQHRRPTTFLVLGVFWPPAAR
ncbi:MAG: hypothetical protein IRZ20_05870 [Thermoleophilia bacterium]|nr:hypothetical protein [Thermoleophilia bacterium]